MSPQSTTDKNLYLLEDPESLQEHLVNMARKARKDIAIFSHSLEPMLFNNEALTSAISTTARRSRNSSIRIIIEEPKVLVDTNHRILTLSQRLVSAISIKKLMIEPQDGYQFMIVDNDKLWLQHNLENFSGFANYAARPEAKRFMTIFNDLWKNSEENARLRQLIL